MTPRSQVVLSVAGSTVGVDPQFGGRLSSFVVDGHELLWQPEVGAGPMPGANHPFGWGSFVMAPYAGRIRHGRFDFDGVSYELPITMPPHAIHGTVYDSAWMVDRVASDAHHATCQLSVPIGDPWPFEGHLVHEISLTETSLVQRLTLHAAESMPATLGWHPWFSRAVEGADGPIEWSFDRTNVSMLQRDADGIASSTLVSVPDGPWDDCFTGVGAVTVRWPGLLELQVSHDCPYVVLFDGLDHAVCVEPQTGPPNAPEFSQEFVSAGERLSASMSWQWRSIRSKA
jgi:aldose 1-epimerase